ncbi:MAG TPA: hypothetical protein PLZ51_11830, partial [Aggregatilineales bacterium]|nr:hypothetical protein [Aggregatilineales bacterium]
MVSRRADSLGTNSQSDNSSLSDDGQYVIFRSFATNLLPEDTNGFHDVFLYSLATQQNVLFSVSDTGIQGNEASVLGRLSGDNQWAVMISGADNFTVPSNQYRDLFLKKVILPIATPSAPTVLLPITGASTTNADTTFTWDVVADATEYQLQIAKDNTFTQLVVDQMLTTTSHTATLPYNYYFWRVRAKQGVQYGTWSEVRPFTRTFAPLNLIAPADMTSTTDPSQTF